MSDAKPSTTEQIKNRASRFLFKLTMIGCLLFLLTAGSFAGGFAVYKFYFEDEKVPCDDATYSCIYNGSEYSNGATFDSTDGCNTCSCSDGLVACTEMACITPTPTSTSTMNPDDYFEKDDFPLVFYEREGLIDNAVKTQFKNKLIDPMTDYYGDTNNANEGHLINIVIEVPENVGDEYIVSAYFLEGYHQGFLYGVRGENLDWWLPMCMEYCTFSAAYEAKYPEIVELSTP